MSLVASFIAGAAAAAAAKSSMVAWPQNKT